MNKFLLPLFLLVATALARGAQTTPHSVVAYANEQQFWVARTDPFNAEFTRIYFRKLGQDDRWQPLARPQSAVDALTAVGPTAAALFKDSSWAMVYGDGSVIAGGSLPGQARMVSFAGGGKTWWAVGVVPGGIAAAESSTRPAPTTRRAATTRAAAAALATGPRC